VPDRDYKRSVWISFYSRRWRYNRNAVDDPIPQRRVVIAQQNRMNRASNSPTEIAGAKTDELSRNGH
jgi:hypothetical protein